MNYDFHAPHVRLTPRILADALALIMTSQLVRRIEEPDADYIFKHALVQDSAYRSLMRHDRKKLHQLVGTSLETLYPERLDENAALLAYHFDRADEKDKTLHYLQRAADQARRAAAHTEQIDLLARAIELAIETGRTDLLPRLHLERGRALTAVTRWQEAKSELLQALNELPGDALAQKSETLNELAEATQWLWDIAASREYARGALRLAEQVGRHDLAAGAMTALAIAEVSDGHPRVGVEYHERAIATAGDLLSTPMARAIEFSGLTLYWLGEYPAAIARARRAIADARAVSDAATVMRGLSNLGLALTAHGEYAEGLAVFAEARAFGEKHGINAWLARSLAMESRVHYDLFDWSGAEALSLEAYALARRARFSAALVSSAIDLMLNYAGRGELALADYYGSEAAQKIPQTYGSHRWLWEIRHVHARAELALARERFDEALAAADEALEKSRALERLKYQVCALETRARIHQALNEHTLALDDFQSALTRARVLGDPALIFRVSCGWLRLAPNDELAATTRAAARRIATALPDTALKDRFLAIASEWV